jgi:hypothetical protein
MEPSNYLPEQLAIDEPNFKYRTDLKPLHVEQSEGVSFSLEGRTLSWQKWKLHFGYSYRYVSSRQTSLIFVARALCSRTSPIRTMRRASAPSFTDFQWRKWLFRCIQLFDRICARLAN